MKTYDIKKFQESNVFKALMLSFNFRLSYLQYYLATQKVNVKEVIEFDGPNVFGFEFSNGLLTSDEVYFNEEDTQVTTYEYLYDSEGVLTEVVISSPFDGIPTSIKFTDSGLDVHYTQGTVITGTISENLTVEVNHLTFTEVEGGVKVTSPVHILTLLDNSAHEVYLPSNRIANITWEEVEGEYQVATAYPEGVHNQTVKIISSESK